MQKRRNSLSLLFLSLSLLSATSCKEEVTDDPISALNGLVDEYGFIGYKNPLDESRTGTMLGGKPIQLAYVAPSDACFPEESVPRHHDRQDFNKRYSYSFRGNLGFTAFGAMLFSAGLGLTKDHVVDIELNGVTVEYMSSIAITEWYQNGMSTICKDYLDDVGFVIQALITDSMRISIRKARGTAISLNLNNVINYLQIEAGVDWNIVDETTIEIKTPKYIGYQLARLRLEDEGRTLYRASEALENRFVFEPISLFDDLEEEQLQKESVWSELDEHSIFME